MIHGKNGFARVSRNLATYRSENKLLDCQNNYVRRSSVMSNAAKVLTFLVTSFNIITSTVWQNYF